MGFLGRVGVSGLQGRKGLPGRKVLLGRVGFLGRAGVSGSQGRKSLMGRKVLLGCVGFLGRAGVSWSQGSSGLCELFWFSRLYGFVSLNNKRRQLYKLFFSFLITDTFPWFSHRESHSLSGGTTITMPPTQ